MRKKHRFAAKKSRKKLARELGLQRQRTPFASLWACDSDDGRQVEHFVFQPTNAHTLRVELKQ